MAAQTYAEKKAAKRARRPIYLVPRRMIDAETGEEMGALVPAHPIDRRLMRERGFRRDVEIRAELKQSRNPAFHRLAHAVGNLLADNVEKFAGKGGHAALKAVQMESGAACETMELDLGPLGKVPVKQPRSLAFDEMSEDDFAEFFKGITEYIGEHYAHVMLDEVRAEFWSMVNGEQSA